MEQTLNPKQLEQIHQLGSRLQKMCQENANKRNEIELRWLRDLRQFHGEYDADELKKMQESKGSQMYRNITRPKCKVAIAQMSKMMLPTDDRNYGIEPTPIPEGISGNLSEEEIQELKDAVKKASDGMLKQIDDDFTEASYPRKCRRVIADGVKVGTGVLKGPVVVNRTRRAWEKDEKGIRTLKTVDEPRPGLDYVNIWNFYPDMSAAELDDAEFTFERLPWTKRKLREFAKLGASKQAIRELLEEGAHSTQNLAQDNLNQLREITGVSSVVDSKLFEVWLYTGPIKREELELCGYQFPEGEEVADELPGMVWFANSKPLKAIVNPLDTGENNYSVWCWEEDESCIFGFGVPHQLRHPQKGANGAVRMMYDNGGLSAGPQVIVDTEIVEPVDGSYALQGRKLWLKKKNMYEPGDKPFEVVQIDCNQPMLAAMLQMAEQAGDEEANIPLIAQGEQDGSITKTHGGMQILANAAMTVFQDPVKNFDDNIIIPVVRRFYDYHMQYNSDAAIKGDYQIKARGSSVLLLKEVQAQAMMQFYSMAANDPQLRRRIDYSKILPALKKALQVTEAGIILDEDQLKDEPADPNMVAMRMDMQMKQDEQQFRQKLELQKLQQTRELEMYKIAAANDMKLVELEQKLGIERQKDKTQRDIAASQAGIKQNEMNLKREVGSGI